MWKYIFYECGACGKYMLFELNPKQDIVEKKEFVCKECNGRQLRGSPIRSEDIREDK